MLLFHFGRNANADDVIGMMTGRGELTPPLTGRVERTGVTISFGNFRSNHRLQPDLRERISPSQIRTYVKL